MTQINKLGVENFRVFNGEFGFNFLPITILTGTNSSGKSSLIKAIRLIKDSIWKTEMNDFRCFHELKVNDELNIGNFDYWVNNRSGSNEFSFILPWNFNFNFGEYSLKLSYKRSDQRNADAKLRSIVILDDQSGKEVLSINEEGFNMDVRDLYEKLVSFSEIKNNILVLINELTPIVSMNFPELTVTYNDFPGDNIDHLNEDEQRKWHEENSVEMTEDCSRFVVMDFIINNSKTSTYSNYNLSFDNWKIKEILNPEQLDKIAIVHELNKKCAKVNSSIMWKSLYNLSPFANFYFTPNTPLLNYNLTKINSSEIQNEKTNIALQLLENDLFCFEQLMNKKDDVSSEINNNVEKFLSMLTEITRHRFHPRSYNNGWPTEGIPGYMNEHPDWTFKERLELLPEAIVLEFGKLEDKTNICFFVDDFLVNSIQSNLNSLKNTFSEIQFIPAFRNYNPSRHIFNSNSDYFSDIVHLLNKMPITDYNEIINECSKLLQIAGIADKVNIKLNEDGTISTINLIDKYGNEANLADFGHGISQILPIFMKLSIENYISKKNTKPKTIIIEEPETNLHPAFQSKLADVFIYMHAKHKCNFIIETHSEYFIRKLQLLTVTDKNSVTQGDVQIYYFYNPNSIPEGETQVISILIDKDGSLNKNFGVGFFDEASNLNIELFLNHKFSQN